MRSFCSLEDGWSLQYVTTCFIEKFKNYRSNARILVIRDEPIRHRGSKEERAFYTALVEFYINWYHLPTPRWLKKKEYTLKKTYYPFSKNLKLEDSPLEFKNRNIVIGKNDVVQA